MNVSYESNSFTIKHKERVVFTHTEENPSLFLGIGDADYDMYRGNFKITDYVTERLPMRKFAVAEESDKTVVTFNFDGEPAIKMILSA